MPVSSQKSLPMHYTIYVIILQLYYNSKHRVSSAAGCLYFSLSMEDVSRQIGKKIRELRKKEGMTQEELADRADVHYTFIGAVERGETNLSLKTFLRVAEALETPVEFFLQSAEGENKSRITEKDIETGKLVHLLRKHDAVEIRKMREIITLLLRKEKASRHRRKK